MCPNRYRELMYKVVDGTASEEETAELRSHIAECDVCRGLFERVRLLDSLLREGMSGRRFDGVWERVRGRMRVRRVAWYVKLGAVAAAAAVVISLLILPFGSSHAVAVAESDLLVEYEGVIKKAGAGEALRAGAVVRNSGGSPVSFRTRRGSHLILGVESALRLLEGARFGVCLLSGQVRVKVNHEPFSVVCNGIEVSVCGTDFVVRRYGAGVEVEVFEGRVRFEAAGKMVFLEAGETGFARWGCPPFKPKRGKSVRGPSVPLNMPLPERPVSLSPQGRPPAPLDLPVPKPPRPPQAQDE